MPGGGAERPRPSPRRAAAGCSPPGPRRSSAAARRSGPATLSGRGCGLRNGGIRRLCLQGFHRRARHALRPDRPVGPHMDLSHRTDHPRLDQLPDSFCPLHGVALIAHLRHDARALRRRSENARFVNRPGERLLHVDRLSRLHRRVGDDRMQVIRRGHDDAVDAVPLPLEHDPEIRIASRLGERFCRPNGCGGFGAALAAAPRSTPLRPTDSEVHRLHVDVDDRHEILAVADGGARVACALSAGPDDREIHRVARCHEARSTQHVSRHDRKAQRGPGHGGDERTSRLILVLHGAPRLPLGIAFRALCLSRVMTLP